MYEYRVYTPVHTNGHQPEPTSLRQDTAEDTLSYQVEIRLLRDRLADKDNVIADLRQRLDNEMNQRNVEG